MRQVRAVEAVLPELLDRLRLVIGARLLTTTRAVVSRVYKGTLVLGVGEPEDDVPSLLSWHPSLRAEVFGALH